MKKSDVELLLYKQSYEGFDYCFRKYSSFPKIKDKEFRKLYDAYIKAADELEGYIRSEAKRHIIDPDEFE
ncbi:MAG TPA: hypothetical protein VMX17_12090 [Candidatus Glassbacteria bacterium]|nr:hypothetical protein [Candidatus Glassbacteria bacterium]